MDKLINLIAQIGGADMEILEKVYPIEKNRFLGMGVIILSTSILASFSMGYLTFILFQSIYISFFVGFFWGITTLIFNNQVVLSMTDSNIYKRVLSGLPKVILGLFIAFIISFPVQIKIFEPTIKQHVIENKMDDSLFSKITSFEELKSEDNLIKWASVAIFLLFFIIEIAPVVVQIIINPSVHYQLMQQRESDIQYQLSKSRLRDELNQLELEKMLYFERNISKKEEKLLNLVRQKKYLKMENGKFWNEILSLLGKNEMGVYLLLIIKSILKIGLILSLYILIKNFEKIAKYQEEFLILFISYAAIELLYVVYKFMRYSQALKYIKP